MRRVKYACVSSSAIPSRWSTQPSRVTLMLKVRSPIATSLLRVGRTAGLSLVDEYLGAADAQVQPRRDLPEPSAARNTIAPPSAATPRLGRGRPGPRPVADRYLGSFGAPLDRRTPMLAGRGGPGRG